MMEFLLMTLVCSIAMSVRGQTFSCRASVNCAGGAGDDLGVAVSGQSCCLDFPRALAYNPVGTEECVACVVVGFLNASYSEVEQEPGHNVPVGYLKGGTVAGQNLVFDVETTPGTAREGYQFDYTVNTLRVRALSNGQIQNVVLTFRVDTVAQEHDETFTLTLNPLVAPTPRLGLFFRNTIQVTIVDNDNIEISFTGDCYHASEPSPGSPTTFLPVLVFKTTRIASRIELVVVPLTVEEARATSLPLPPDIPVDDPRSPPFANLADFNNTNITLIFEPDEDAAIYEMSAPNFVTDDDINEAREQVFVAELILVSSLDPARIDLTTRPSTLCSIVDYHDSIRIGFELPGYTYTEPQFDEFIDEFYASPTGQPENGPIFLVKEGNVTSEQTFLVSFQVADSAPPGIKSATIDQDYRFRGAGVTSQTEFFFPSQQRIPFRFELRTDTFPEGTEAFQASVSPEDTRDLGGGLVEQFPTSLQPITLAYEVFITTLDDDPIIIGFTNTSYTVDEGIGNLQVDVRVFNPPNDQPLPVTIDLVIQTVSGSATGGSDYAELSADFADVLLIFSDTNHRQSFRVTILNDSLFELDVENFTLELRFDPFLPPPSNVILSPIISIIEILDKDSVAIGFLNTVYTVGENDGAVNIQFGIIQGSLERSVVVQFSTNDISATDGSDYSGFAGLEFTFDSVTRVAVAPVSLIRDNTIELTESFGASLAFSGAPPSRVTLSPDSSQVTILDDDSQQRMFTASIGWNVDYELISIDFNIHVIYFSVPKFGFENQSQIVIGFSADSISIASDETLNGTVTLTIRVLNGTINEGNTVAVRVTTADNSAEAPSDYISVSQVLTFSSSSTAQIVQVPIVNDSVMELTEVFTASLSLENSNDHVELMPNLISVTISDDDELVLGFSATEYEVHENDVSVIIEISFIHGIPGDYQPVVLISTHNGTAIEGSDFAAVASSAVTTFTAVNQVKILAIPIISSNSTESSKEFTVTLDEVILIYTNNRTTVNLSNQERDRLILNPRVANITILDDNVAVIGFLNTNLTTLEGKGTLNFTIGVLQGYLDTFVTVLFTTEASSAKAGSDYIEASRVIVFTGDSVQHVSIQIIDDGISEPPETLSGLLSGADGTVIPPNVRLEPTRATAIIINTNDRTENNSLVTMLAVVLVCILVFLTLITAIVVVIYLIFKKKGKRKRKLPEHVYDSVTPPPISTHSSLSGATNLDYDEVKTTSDSTATQFELTDNVAYNSFKPPAAAENSPNTGSTVANL